MAALITSSKVSCVSFGCDNLAISEAGDTVLHSWEVLAKILASEDTMNIVCDIGM
jgi:NAD+ synthase (glutamine-hydrolysing)